MYVECEIHDIKDFADLVEVELFNNATDEEAADCLLDMIHRYKNFYHKKENKADKQKLNSMYGVHLGDTENFLSGAILGYCQSHEPEEIAELFNATFNVIPKDKGLNIAACISRKGILTYGLKEVENNG